jgi:hypothetical protein
MLLRSDDLTSSSLSPAMHRSQPSIAYQARHGATRCSVSVHTALPSSLDDRCVVQLLIRQDSDSDNNNRFTSPRQPENNQHENNQKLTKLQMAVQ